MPVKKSQRQILQMAIEPVAHGIDDAQPNIITEIMLAEVEQTACAEDNDDG
jgi:hypothetical protein